MPGAAREDHGLRFSLQDTYDLQGNPNGGRTQMRTFFGRANGTLRLDLSKVVGIEGATIYSGSICSLVSRTPFDTIVKAFT
jgi:hypothetical protein